MATKSRFLSLLPVGVLLAAGALLDPFPARADAAPGVTDADAQQLLRFSSGWSFLVWPAGSTLTGCFFAGDSALRAQLVASGEDWARIANIKFDFGRPPAYRDCDGAKPSDIRVAFRPEFGGQSRIGTRALDANPQRPTVYIGVGADVGATTRTVPEIKGTMLHELGHVLGLPHEHNHPDSPCPGEFRLADICGRDGASIAADVGETQPRLEAMIRLETVTRLAGPQSVMSRPYDVDSIMHYRFHAGLLKSGVASRCHSRRPREISPGDRARLAILYPGEPDQQLQLLRHEGPAWAAAMTAHGVSGEAFDRIIEVAETDLRRRFPALELRIDRQLLEVPTIPAVEPSLLQVAASPACR